MAVQSIFIYKTKIYFDGYVILIFLLIINSKNTFISLDKKKTKRKK